MPSIVLLEEYNAETLANCKIVIEAAQGSGWRY